MSSFVIVADPFSSRVEREHVVLRPISPHILNSFAAGVAATLSSSLYNPLDCLRVRWQVLSPNRPGETILSFGVNIVRKEGLLDGLWRPGLAANALGMGLSSSIRFGCYEPVRNMLMADNEKSYQHMVLAGLVTGSVGYVVTTPFHLLKTTIQAQQGRQDAKIHNLVSGFRHIVTQKGLFSLYKGAIPLSTRGALFTAGQLMGYDGMKTWAKSQGFEDNAMLHVVSGVSASFWASFLSAPADLVMAKFMACPQKQSLAKCITDIYAQGGLVGFWRGWSVFFLRLTPSLLTYSTVYEKLRQELGLGYFD